MLPRRAVRSAGWHLDEKRMARLTRERFARFGSATLTVARRIHMDMDMVDMDMVDMVDMCMCIHPSTAVIQP